MQVSDTKIYVYVKVLTLLLLATLFLSGCGAEKKTAVTSPKPLPSWYTNPPQSDQHFLYEVAEGRDKQGAIANALNLMASTLSVTIASDYTSHTKERSGGVESYQQDIESSVKAKVKALRISNYRVLESTQQGFRRHLVLIQSDKQQLFESLKQELDAKILVLDDQKAHIGDKNVVEQLRFYKKADSDFSAIEHTLTIMNVLNSAFDSRSYIAVANRYKSSYNDLRAKITFDIEANSDGSNLVEPIKAGLSARKLLVENRRDLYHLNILINAESQTVHSMGFDLARTAISLTTRDHLGTTIGSNKINIIGQSTQGYAVAKENVAIKLKRMIDKEGVESVLGLEF